MLLTTTLTLMASGLVVLTDENNKSVMKCHITLGKIGDDDFNNLIEFDIPYDLKNLYLIGSIWTMVIEDNGQITLKRRDEYKRVWL